MRSPTRQADIEEIYLHIAIEGYQSYVESLASMVFKTFDLICHNPQMATERTRSGEGIRLYPMDKVNIFYRVVNKRLQILRVHHNALDSDKLWMYWDPATLTELALGSLSFRAPEW